MDTLQVLTVMIGFSAILISSAILLINILKFSFEISQNKK